MSCYVVAYDLMKSGQNYECLIKKLKAYGTYWHAQGSVWFVVSDQTAVQIRDSLSSCLDSNDKLIVAKLEGEAAWIGYGKEVSDWLLEQL